MGKVLSGELSCPCDRSCYMMQIIYNYFHHLDHSGPSSVNGEEESQAPEVIRGRIKTEDKAGTYNQLWTVEEQKR